MTLLCFWTTIYLLVITKIVVKNDQSTLDFGVLLHYDIFAESVEYME